MCYYLELLYSICYVVANWQTTSYIYRSRGEQEIPNKIEGIPSQALFLEKLKKTLHKFKQCKKPDFKQNNL